MYFKCTAAALGVIFPLGSHTFINAYKSFLCSFLNQHNAVIDIFCYVYRHLQSQWVKNCLLTYM